MLHNKEFEVLSQKTGISVKQVERTVALLDDGGTIPFISRYRKEQTGGLDEVQVKCISEQYLWICDLIKRKEHILKIIDDSGKLTDELRRKIETTWDSVELEDIYLPFKPKRKTKAEIARQKGLEPLAKIIMSQNNDDIIYKAKRFVNKEVNSTDDAINGAKDIIAEWISENIVVRNRVRSLFERTAILQCKVVKGKEDEAQNYKNYFDLSESIKRCASHRLLAMLRGESEGFLKLIIKVDDEVVLNRILQFVVKGNSESSMFVIEAAKDSYKRLLKPSIESEIMASAKEKADDVAIETFANNLRQLLFAAPLVGKNVLAIDPGFRTGCKVVCLDKKGDLLCDDVIYPTMPKGDIDGATKKITHLVNTYKIDAIALGNGTASRETEAFLRKINTLNEVPIFIVNESGASIYSASDVAREEFPDKDVTVRGSVSIGRRLLDPMAELVKIDPKSIGVGQYQHDVNQKKLKYALDFVVESCVNSVGVNLNTASKELLTYVSGVGPQLAQNIVNYRCDNGVFESRKDLLKVPRFGAMVFQQASAFLRIQNAKNPLDNSAVHPESYCIVEKMASDCGCSVIDLIGNKENIAKIDIKRYITSEVGEPTLLDIIKELEKPGRDPRGEAETFVFDANVKTIEDLQIGMVLNGKVTNITQFGAFVDIGLHENGLLHISEMYDKFISSPDEIVTLNQCVKVKVKDVDLSRKRISLSMKGF